MANIIDANGLQTATVAEIIDKIENGAISFPGFLTIFPGANVDPNSPDGNWINIIAQVAVDQEEFLAMIYASFDPDQAIGVSLDERCAINGVIRQAGTNTVQPISVTSTVAVTIYGIDQTANPVFTVQDAQGNQYQLAVTYSFLTGSTQSLAFQAVNLGAVQSSLNTITSIVTVTAGISAVNNPATYTTLGIPEETDATLRIRRANSVALPSKGWLEGMYAGIIDVTGVTAALVLENYTNSINGYNMPPHSIWIIVAGDPDEDELAQAIYVKRNAGVDWTNGGSGGAGTGHRTGTTVTSITVAAGGTRYDNAPMVEIVSGTGSGASAHATVSGGVITGFVMDSIGTGYATDPTIVLNPNTVKVPITQVDGTTFDVFYDTPQGEGLYFQAVITAITGSIDLATIKAAILAEFGRSYGINETADSTAIVAFIKGAYPNASVSGEGVGTDGVTYNPTVAPTNVNYQFNIPSVANIDLT